MKLHDICTTNNGNIFIHTAARKHAPLSLLCHRSTSKRLLTIDHLYNTDYFVANFISRLL